MNTDTIRLGLPWQMSHYRILNGPHPLVRSFIEGNAAIECRNIDLKAVATGKQLDAVLRQLVEQSRCLPSDDVSHLIAALNIPEQVTIEADGDNFDCLYLHTSPMYAGSRPFIFHFESFQSLFLPYVLTGNTRGADLLHSGYSAQIRNALESEQCIRIFSHMKGSLASLRSVFESEGISAKAFHVPLGIQLQSLDKITAKFKTRGPLRILFTNSLHQDPNSFYLRGGHLLLDAFARLRRTHPHARLTILSSVPADLLTRFKESFFEGVEWLQAGVSDRALEELFLDHHVFALPAAGLHSLSLLRALANGCIPIVSDACGYEEYLAGIGTSTRTVKGICEMVYRNEQGGWTSDSYEGFSALSEHFVVQIQAHLESLASDGNLESMAIENYLHCRINHDPAESSMAFMKMLTGRPVT